MINCGRRVSSIWILSCLLLTGSNAQTDVIRKSLSSTEGSSSLHRRINAVNNQFLRSMYTFDQDDLFLEHTTEVPSVSSAPSISQAPSSSPSQSSQPTLAPTSLPTSSPTYNPTSKPSSVPTISPTSMPTSNPSEYPTLSPSSSPSDEPSSMPTSSPTSPPSVSPSRAPVKSPSVFPSSSPTFTHSATPSQVPSLGPSVTPTSMPSSLPSPLPTAHPTSSPSTHPSTTPTVHPSLAASFAPSSKPTTQVSSSPSASPSNVPTKSPSLSPTYSSQPSQSPTSSIAPSSKPSTSQSPSVFNLEVELSMFFIEIISQDGISDVDGDLIVEIGEQFLTNYFNSELPSEYIFKGLELEKVSNLRRRLNVKSSTACVGVAHFGARDIPNTDELDEYVIQAFKDEKKDFLVLLQNSNSPNLAQAINAGAKRSSFPKAGSFERGVTARTIVLVVCGVTIGAVALSLFAQQMIKRGMEKRINTHAFKYAKQIADENEAAIAPMPLVISDDENAVERSMIRLQHEREVMRRANERLQRSHRREAHRSRKVGFRDGQVSKRQSADEDESTITSIQFSSSGESTVSSLALNPVDPIDPMDPIDLMDPIAEDVEDTEHTDDASDEMDSTERRMVEINAEASDIINKLSVGGFGGLMPCGDADEKEAKSSSGEAVANTAIFIGGATDIPLEVYAGESDSIGSKNGHRSEKHGRIDNSSQYNSQPPQQPQPQSSLSQPQSQLQGPSTGRTEGGQGENSYFTNIFTRRY